MRRFVLAQALWFVAAAALAEEPAPDQGTPSVQLTAPPVRTPELLDPGRGRRVTLRLTPAPGDSWDAQLQRETRITTAYTGAPPSVDHPPDRVHDLRLTVGDELRLAFLSHDLVVDDPATLVHFLDQLARWKRSA